MFKKSPQSTAPSLFSSYTQHLSGSKLEQLENKSAWHNCFYREITSRIPEEVFGVLYDTKQGRPNAAVRQLVAMLILKEGQNWTDEQLFEACDFNLLIQRALGLTNLSDAAPSPATYYNFKSSLLSYQQQTGQDLLQTAFETLTKDQVIRYSVSGSQVRMDTKLVHSNIAKSSRLQLVLRVVSKFYKSLTEQQSNRISQEDNEKLNELTSQSASQHTYRLTKKEVGQQLVNWGKLIYRLYTLFENLSSDEYDLLSRVWEEHFEICSPLEQEQEDHNDGDQDVHINVLKRPTNGGSSLQSPDDPEAGYRNKPGSKKQVIRGFVSNITETCDPDGLRLITAVQTEKVTASDDSFFSSAIQQSQMVLKDPIETVLSDGAFNSQPNKALSQDPTAPFDWYVSAIQGAEGHYDFELINEQTYRVTDRRTGHQQNTVRTPAGKYRISEHHAKTKYRYFDVTTIENYFRRKAIKKYPRWVQGRRANVEATIYQVFCHLKGAKTKYRGLLQHHHYALNRSLWVNFKRIMACKAEKALELVILTLLPLTDSLNTKSVCTRTNQNINQFLFGPLSRNWERAAF